MEEQEIGFTRQVIPYSKRIALALLIFIPTCLITWYLWWKSVTSQDETALAPYVSFIIGSVWAWKVFHKDQVIEYEVEFVDRIDMDGKHYTEEMTTDAALEAMARHQRIEKVKKDQFWDGFIDELDQPLYKYSLAIASGLLGIGCLQSDDNKLQRFGVACLILAVYLAKDLLMKLGVVALVILIVVIIYGLLAYSISAMSIPVAIIIGALIIATAVQSKK